MYGPPTAPPPPRRDIRAEVLRWLFAVVPLLSLGVLSWVPFLHIATRRGRRSDWLFATLYGVLSAGELTMLITIPSDNDSTAGAIGGTYTVLLILGACVHAALTGYLPSHSAHPPQQQPLPSPYGTPHPTPPPTPGAYATPTPSPSTSSRMRQVASELDELGEYLRRQEGR
ncbi:hypothetical protein [Streptomyces sp. NPDC049881]|uniref:hypothetical protein n=1 Tax=Streptomyces sp. NPDC049881 TaxID=3155778 RepID=UPI003413AF6A